MKGILLLGKILIVSGALFSIHPFLIAIGLPLYSIGNILTWTSPLLIKADQLKWTIYPLIGITSIWILIVLVEC